MKDEIVIKGERYFYRTFVEDSHYGDYYYTRFWKKNKVIFDRLTCFDKKRKLIVPDYLFTIHEDSKNENLSKAWWKNKILLQIELLNRNKQLNNGELI